MVLDNIYKIMVSNFEMNIQSVDIIQVILDGTCLLKIIDLIKSLLWLYVNVIIFCDRVPQLFPSIISVLVRRPLFQYFLICTMTNICEPLLVIIGLHDGELIILAKDLFLKVLYVSSAISYCWYLVSY